MAHTLHKIYLYQLRRNRIVVFPYTRILFPGVVNAFGTLLHEIKKDYRNNDEDDDNKFLCLYNQCLETEEETTEEAETTTATNNNTNQ